MAAPFFYEEVIQMHMKYFQAVGRILDRYDDTAQNLEIFGPEHPWTEGSFKRLGISPLTTSTIQEFKEDRNVLRYILCCQWGLSHYAEDIYKPDVEIVNRCLNRYISYLEKLFEINDYNVNKHRMKNVAKQYKACRHYLFKFSQGIWYHKLPDMIPCFATKYPDK